MLKRRKNLPLDYSLCTQTVTVYREKDMLRQVLEGVYYEHTQRLEDVGGVTRIDRGFLLIIPGDWPICPGDVVIQGIGPEISGWEDLKAAGQPGMGRVASALPRYYKGRVCHTEARG